MAFRNGILVFEEEGALPASELNSVIEIVRSFDMEAVEAEAATKVAAHSTEI